MESVSNISSEEELLRLYNEGKISENEYEQLRAAMQKTPQADVESVIIETDKVVPKRKLGIIAFILMLAGIILPILIYFPFMFLIDKHTAKGISLLAFYALEFASLGIGITARTDIFGKAAAIASLIIIIAFSLFSILFVPVTKLTPQHVTDSEIIELKRFTLDNMDGVITRAGVQIDKQISSDGNGSLRIEATEPATIRLFETNNIDIENALLTFQAKVRTENVEGQVYLEMWCCFSDQGEFFSKGIDSHLSGTTEWTTEQTPVLLKTGQNPDNVKLNLVINGKGTAWIDDIRLFKRPLRH